MKRRHYVWTAHYNKPASLKAGKVMWSVHFRGKCHIVPNISMFSQKIVFTKSKKTQPVAVMKGYAQYCVANKNGAILGNYEENV